MLLSSEALSTGGLMMDLYKKGGDIQRNFYLKEDVPEKEKAAFILSQSLEILK